MDLLDRFVTRPISYSILQVDFKIIAVDVLDRQSLEDRFSVTNVFFSSIAIVSLDIQSLFGQ